MNELTKQQMEKEQSKHLAIELGQFLQFVRVNYEPFNNRWIDKKTGNKSFLDDDLVCEFLQLNNITYENK